MRVTTYWVPELGENVSPIKVWLPMRMRNDLQTLAGYAALNLSQYVRESVISRVLGHGSRAVTPRNAGVCSIACCAVLV